MILGIILVCTSAIDINTCYMFPNTQEFFQTMDECEEVGFYAAEHFAIRYNVYTKAECFETDFFELI
jgi:hypothetical protein